MTAISSMVWQMIVHIDEQTQRYLGKLFGVRTQRAAQMILAAGTIEKQNRKRAHLESFISRFKAKARRQQAQSRIKSAGKDGGIAPLRAAEFSFEFREPLSAPNPMLVMEDVDCGYRIESATDHSFTEKCIVSDVKFSLQIGQRIGLLGVNGAGKSTLIKTIVGDIPPLHGTMQTGKGLTIGYFAQHQVEMLRHDESPLWHLAHIAPDARAGIA
jgi:ATP-binding cassette subfamily F protein 3